MSKLFNKCGGIADNSSNPCFDGDCLVDMADGSRKKVRNIIKGDIVATLDGLVQSDATIKCVIRTDIENGRQRLVMLDGGLFVTPWHPIRKNGRWIFPANLGEPQEIPCSAVFSFVLDKDHIMIINNTECITLGHDFKEDIVQHPYFGTNKVIDDLKNMDGWSDGLIVLKSGCSQRDESGIVCKLSQN